MDTTALAGFFNDTVVDALDLPRASGGAGRTINQWVHELTGDATWDSQNLEWSEGNTPTVDLQLVLDISGNPRAAFGVLTNPASIRYMIGDPRDPEEPDEPRHWNTITADTFRFTPFGLYGVALCLDTGDQPVIAYSFYYTPPLGSTSPGSELRLAKPSSTDWDIESVVAGPITFGVSLALDKLNRPVLSYYETPSTSSGTVFLRIARWNGTEWIGLDDVLASWSVPWSEVAPISSVSNVGQSIETSIDLDSRGKIHLAYYDPVDKDLMYYAEP